MFTGSNIVGTPLVKDRQHLTTVMQRMQNITQNALKNNLKFFKETVQFSDGDLDSLEEEFKEINDHTQSVLVNSLTTVLRQKNILTDQICNHSTIFDIAEVNKVCTDYLQTLLRLTLTEIGQSMQEERDLFLEFQTN